MPDRTPEVRTPQQGGTIEQQFRQLASFFDTAIAECSVSLGEEDFDVRRISFQVRDRLKKPWSGNFVILVWFSETEGGTPSSTGNNVTNFGVGTTELKALTTNAVYLLITNAQGKAEIDLEIAGAAIRYFSGIVIGRPKESAAEHWAA